MSRLRLESPPLAGHAGPRRCEAHHTARPPRVHLTRDQHADLVNTSASGPNARLGTASAATTAVAAAALAACGIGLVGVDAGLLWIVAGVLTVRSLNGGPVGGAWAVACIGAGMRWGTFGLGDLETATRLLGPTVAAGEPTVRIGMTVALAAAVLEEAAADGLLRGPWPARGAALVAGIVLVPVFLVGGPSGLGGSGSTWAASAAAVLIVIALSRPFAARLPAWAPIALASAGVLFAVGNG